MTDRGAFGPSLLLEVAILSKLVVMLVSMAGAYESYVPGDKVLVSDEVADAWVGAQIAEIFEEKPQKVTELEPDDPIEGLKHLGGGYYELPNGEKVRGKDSALEALAALAEKEKAGEGDDTEGGDASNGRTGDAGGSQITPES
jgi:hypothetical protein